MTLPGRIAVTGAQGRLGRALVGAIAQRTGAPPIAWSRPELDLDVPATLADLVARDRPELVLHAAAWTDVDACAREPERAHTRNAQATGALARACVASGARLLVVSTNEVFPGDRTDGRGYVETDPPRPANAYGTSKLAAEEAATAAFDGRDGLWVVRVAWLFGPTGDDFPERIVRVADRLAPEESLGLVDDEHGNPTCTTDLAASMVRLVDRTVGGTWHLVGDPPATRAELGRAVLRRLRPDRATHAVSRTAFRRDSTPPAWGVLDTGRATAEGIAMRPWPEALGEELERRDRTGRRD